MITPRQTRLVRAADPAAFRRAIGELVLALSPFDASETFVLTPTRAAGEQLRRTLEARQLATTGALALPALGARADLYDALHLRLPEPARRLTAFEREVMIAAAAREAIAAGTPAPFTLRPGLIAEILNLYDALRRQLRTVARFEEYLAEELERDLDSDRGAVRMLQQTRFLAATFRGYEARVGASGALDEHVLRDRLIAEPSRQPLTRLIVTMVDRAADPHGLWLSDFDLMARLPGLRYLDIVATEAMLAAGFLERLHGHLPELGEDRVTDPDWGRPMLEVPSAGEWVFQSRDREEELAAVARRVKAERRAGRRRPLSRTALVVRRPLPYLYLAREVFGDAGIPFETLDTLPLAAEPFAAALDLVFEWVATGFTRATSVALLRSPHFAFATAAGALTPEAVSALDRALADARYVGGLPHLTSLADEWSGRAVGGRREQRLRRAAAPAAAALRDAARGLAPIAEPRPVPEQMRDLLAFLASHHVVDDEQDAADGPPRARRVRAAVLGALAALSDAYARHDPATPMALAELAAAVRRWLGGQTFAPRTGDGGLQILDAASAPYGEFDHVQLVGLIEGEWPERERRSIFYPSILLKNLQWPDEKDRLSGGRAAFLDLLHLARERTTLSTITLEDDAIVEPSALLEEVEAAGLPQVVASHDLSARVFGWEALALDPQRPDVLAEEQARWAEFRARRTPAESPEFHGDAGPWTLPRVSVSRVERYLECPFRFFAAEVLGLEEEPEDDDARTPLERGRFLHELFERFYQEWGRRHGGQITPGRLAEARPLFEALAEAALATLSPTDAALERPRLLGSAVSAGIAERVFSMEAERPTPITERLLEFPLEGTFTFHDADGAAREVALRGKADRIDVLAGGALRVIDYKSKKVPHPAKALQLPIYGLCATTALEARRGGAWTLDEACYVSFEGSRAVVPLGTARQPLPALVADAEARMLRALDDIAAGRFPPRPDDRQRCAVCAFGTVCRKEYVTDEPPEGDVPEPGDG